MDADKLIILKSIKMTIEKYRFKPPLYYGFIKRAFNINKVFFAFFLIYFPPFIYHIYHYQSYLMKTCYI